MKPTAKARPKVFSLRMSDEEAAAVDSAAKESDLPTATWIRAVILKQARTIAKKAGDKA